MNNHHHFTIENFKGILDKFVQNFEILSKEVLMLDLIEPFFQSKLMNGHVGRSVCQASQNKILAEKQQFLDLLNKGQNAFQSISKIDKLRKNQFYEADTKILKGILKKGMTPGYPKPAKKPSVSAQRTTKFTTPSETVDHGLNLMFSSIHSSMPPVHHTRPALPGPPAPQRVESRRPSDHSNQMRPRSKSVGKPQGIFSFQVMNSPRKVKVPDNQTSVLSNAFSRNFDFKF